MGLTNDTFKEQEEYFSLFKDIVDDSRSVLGTHGFPVEVPISFVRCGQSFMLLAAVTIFGSMDGHLNFYIMQYRILSGYATDSTSLT